METESWFEDYAEEMYKYILFMVKDRGTAEDLTQDTFIKAFVHSCISQLKIEPLRNLNLSHL